MSAGGEGRLHGRRRAVHCLAAPRAARRSTCAQLPETDRRRSSRENQEAACRLSPSAPAARLLTSAPPPPLTTVRAFVSRWAESRRALSALSREATTGGKWPAIKLFSLPPNSSKRASAREAVRGLRGASRREAEAAAVSVRISERISSA